jgi:GNAT superfamily N-acetyltransferase
MSPVEIVTDVYEHPALRESLFALFDRTWRFLRPKEALAGRLGFPWRQVSTPFAAVERGQVLAHAGLLPLELRVAGQEVTIGAVHAVCVAPERRGQGLGREVLAAALAAADARYATVVLSSEKEALYAKFGFAPRSLHLFVTPGLDGEGRARPLDVGRAEDARLWLEAMRTRVALSRRFAVLDRGAVNTFDAMNIDGSHAPLWHDERLGVVYYARLDGGRVVIDDLFAPAPVDGACLLAGLPWTCREVVFGFDPEALGLPVRVEPRRCAPGDDRLLIRGPLVDERVPLAWPAYSFT